MKIGFDAYVVDNPMVGDVKSEMGRSRPGLIRSGKILNAQVDQQFMDLDNRMASITISSGIGPSSLETFYFCNHWN